jgi:two-component system, HptB-dependent secretion and biofilm response regulator
MSVLRHPFQESESSMSTSAGGGAPDTGDRMEILVVDDSPSIVALLRSYLTAQGHGVTTVEDGEAAVDAFARLSPDLVLLDVVMPGMDGIEVTRRLRSISRDRWVPVILVSSLQTEQDVVRGLEAGADDYLPKPINLAVLKAKIRSFHRIVQMQTEMRSQTDMLRRLQDEQTCEHELAASLIKAIVQRVGLQEPGLAWRVMPSARFSGDVVAAERGVDGTFYALLADATGHGLTASVSLIPALQIFYGMARKGLPLGQIVREINARLREQLPVGRYVAALMVAIHDDDRRFEYWNGGMPPALVLSADGQSTRELKSDQVALGILPDADFDDSCRELRFVSGERLVAYSDGLIEAADLSGEPYGMERLLAAVHAPTGKASLDRVMNDLHAHLDCAPHHDDASIFTIDLG